MSNLCDICGREMVPDIPYGYDDPWMCPASPDQHKIAELEKQLKGSRALVKQLADDKQSFGYRFENRTEEREEARSQLRASQERELALREALRWIPISEDTPATGERVFVTYTPDKGIWAAEIHWDSVADSDARISHWMLLPHPAPIEHPALSNTSAAAAQTVERIEREALEKAVRVVLTMGRMTLQINGVIVLVEGHECRHADVRSETHQQGYRVWSGDGLHDIRAAILGEKEKG